MQIVVCKFYDPTTFSHWALMDEVDKSTCRVCQAVGWLIEENDEWVKVALLRTEGDDSVSNWVVVPSLCVLSLDTIDELQIPLGDRG